MLCHAKGNGPHGVGLSVVGVWSGIAPWDAKGAGTIGAARGEHCIVYLNIRSNIRSTY